MDFKDRLKELRSGRGFTQEKLAAELNVPESTIRRYESMEGTPKRERLELIADYFNVTVDFLIGRADESPRTELTTEEKTDLEKKFVEKYQALTALRLKAESLGVPLDDPLFLQIVADAYELAVIRRKKDEQDV